MLQKIEQLHGYTVAGTDGDLGHVQDFYFEDNTWAIRYLVVNTGTWLTGRLVLLSPHAFRQLDHEEKRLHVKLHKKQIENSPSIDAHHPVSRQYEKEYYQYYGWPAYWEVVGIGGASFPVVAEPVNLQGELDPGRDPLDDAHLRSAAAVKGYHVHAEAENIGTVRDFMVDDKSWAILHVVVETGHWYAGKQILVSTNRIERIGHNDSTIFVSLTKADIRKVPGS